MRSALREAYRVATAATATHRRLRDALVAIAVATLGVDLICAAIAYLLERHGQQTESDARNGQL